MEHRGYPTTLIAIMNKRVRRRCGNQRIGLVTVLHKWVVVQAEYEDLLPDFRPFLARAHPAARWRTATPQATSARSQLFAQVAACQMNGRPAIGEFC
jgi:hypothetical protein